MGKETNRERLKELIWFLGKRRYFLEKKGSDDIQKMVKLAKERELNSWKENQAYEEVEQN